MVNLLGQDLCTIVKFHVFSHTHLAEDLFIMKSDGAFSDVKKFPRRKNIESAMLYAEEACLVPMIGEYLQGKIDQWNGYRQESLVREAEAFNSVTSQMQRGLYRGRDGSRQQSETERERINNQDTTITRYRQLLHAVNSEGIESYLRNLEAEFFYL